MATFESRQEPNELRFQVSPIRFKVDAVAQSAIRQLSARWLVHDWWRREGLRWLNRVCTLRSRVAGGSESLQIG